MVETTLIANEIRKHIAKGVTKSALIALVADLVDLYPDMTIAQLSVAMHEAVADRLKTDAENACAIRDGGTLATTAGDESCSLDG
jgi:hypothetical protein